MKVDARQAARTQTQAAVSNKTSHLRLCGLRLCGSSDPDEQFKSAMHVRALRSDPQVQLLRRN
jgi:hypothetical protein